MRSEYKKIIIKNILLILLIINIFGCATSEKEQSSNINNNQKKLSSISYIKDGEYAFYLDKRYTPNLYRGYMKFTSRDNQIGIIVRNIDTVTGKEDNFIFVVDDDENGYPSIIKDINGQLTKIGMQAVPDFINFSSLYIKTQNDYDKQSDVDDDWGDFILVFSFDKSLPFFRFSNYKLKENNEIFYLFLFGGVLKQITLDAFFEIDPAKSMY